MEKWYRLILDHLKDHPPDYGDDNAQSVLEMLYGYYNQYNRMDTDAIKAGFEDLYEKMTGMPLRDMDDIIYTTCSLCREHEKSGFVEGVKVGVLLAEELKETRGGGQTILTALPFLVHPSTAFPHQAGRRLCGRPHNNRLEH